MTLPRSKLAHHGNATNPLDRRSIEYLACHLRPASGSTLVLVSDATLLTLLELAEWVLDEQEAGRCEPPSWLVSAGEKTA